MQWLVAIGLLSPQGGQAQQPHIALAPVEKQAFTSCISRAGSHEETFLCHQSRQVSSRGGYGPQQGTPLFAGRANVAVPAPCQSPPHGWEQKDVLRQDPV